MTRNFVRLQHRLLERLFQLLGLAQRHEPVWAPIESLEQRTLMSIAALNAAVHNATGIFAGDTPQIAANASGNYVVVWSSGGLAGGGAGDDGQLKFSLFDNTDTAIISNVAVTGTLRRAVPGGSAPGTPGTLSVTSLDHPSYSVAINASGNFVIVWDDNTDILAQRFDATGTAVGSAIDVSQGGSGNETVPSVAMDAAGDFAVTWLADHQVSVNIKTMTPKSYYDYVDVDTNTVKRHTDAATTNVSANSYTTSIVMARRFDATGSGGTAITVSPAAAVTAGTSATSTFTTNLNPGIAMDSAGDFAVAWDANGYIPKKTLGTAASKTTGTAYTYDSHNNQHTVTLHYYTGPAFYYNMGLSGAKLMIQRFDTTGAVQGTAITALTKTSSTTAGTLVAEDASIAMDSAGDFAVSGTVQYAKLKVIANLSANYYATSSALSIRRFSAAAKAGAEVHVASAALTPFFSSSPNITPEITDATIAMDPTGNMMVTWDQAAYSVGVQDVASTGVFARRYTAASAAQETAPFQINVGTVTGNVFPHVAFSGGLMDLAYNNNGNLFTQRFRPILADSKVIFSTQPTSSGPGILHEVDVEITDANGFVDTTNTSTVALSIFSGTKGAKLLGTTSVKAVNGVAIFTGLSLARGGNYVLKATDGKLASSTSSTFQIITTPTHLAFTTVPKTVTAGISPTVIVSVEDANGDVAVGDGSTITLSASGTGSLLDTVTVAAVNGVATFNAFVIPTIGTYTLTANDGALTPATSPPFTVNPGHAAFFFFTTPPVSNTAGTKFNVQVTARDIFNNLATLDRTKITLTLAGSNINGAIVGPRSVTLNKGVANFTGISIAAAGTYTLSAAGGATSATSNSFIISAAAAAKLAYLQSPVTTVAGHAINPAVQVAVEDKFGNVVLTNTSAITLTVASSPKSAAAPTGTLVQNASAGVATFTGITFTSEGPYSLKAAQGALSVTSGSFTIQPDVPSQVAFISPLNSVTAGAGEGTVTVAIEDQFHNIETTSSALVTITINSGPGGATLLGTATASAVHGIATFKTLALHTAGTYTLSAASGTLTAGVSNSFIISPAAAKSLAFLNQPSDVNVGQTMSSATTVEVLDTFGNVVTADHSLVKLTVHTGPLNPLPLLNASASAVSGVASFATLTLQTSGSYTLTAADGHLTSAISNSFNVSALVG